MKSSKKRNVSDRIPKKYSFRGKKIYLAEECRKRALDYFAVIQRIKSGWSVEEALSTPIRKKKAFLYKGKNYTLRELCEKQGWNYSFISNQIYLKNKSLNEAMAALKIRAPRTRRKKI